MNANEHELAESRLCLFAVLKDFHHHPSCDLVGQANGIPIRESDASVTRRAPNRVWIIGTMDTDPLFVQTNPYNTNQISGAGWNQIIVPAAAAVLQHCLIPTKIRKDRHLHNFPGTDRRR